MQVPRHVGECEGRVPEHVHLRRLTVLSHADAARIFYRVRRHLRPHTPIAGYALRAPRAAAGEAAHVPRPMRQRPCAKAHVPRPTTGTSRARGGAAPFASRGGAAASSAADAPAGGIGAMQATIPRQPQQSRASRAEPAEQGQQNPPNPRQTAPRKPRGDLLDRARARLVRADGGVDQPNVAVLGRLPRGV